MESKPGERSADDSLTKGLSYSHAKEKPVVPSVRDAAGSCLDLFASTLRADVSARIITSDPPPVDAQPDHGQLRIEQDRFRIWAANASAFAEGRYSLDYRLRELPQEIELVKSLLNIVSTRLESYNSALVNAEKPEDQDCIAEAVSGARTLLPGSARQDDGVEAEVDKVSHTGSSPEAFNYIEALHSMHTSIDWLHRLCNMLRRASVVNQNLRAQINNVPGFDGDTVKRLYAFLIDRDFPGLSEQLKSRMASTMVERHRRILYRRDRLDSGWKQQETYERKTEENQPPPTTTASQSLIAGTEPSTETKISDTPATKAASSLEPKGPVTEPAHSRYYAPSSVSTARSGALNKDAKLLIPPPPPEYLTSDEFVCDYCCVILESNVGRNKDQWEKHIKQDLDAYVCLFDNCDHPHDIYSSSKKWLGHMSSEHLVRWACTSIEHDDELEFLTKDELEEHMKESHPNAFSEEMLPYMLEAARTTTVVVFESCPFCGEKPDAIGEHISNHLRYLALKSIPWPEHAIDVDEDAEDIDYLAMADPAIERETVGQFLGSFQHGSFHLESQRGSIEPEYGGGSLFDLEEQQLAPRSEIDQTLGNKRDRQLEWGFMTKVFVEHEEWKRLYENVKEVRAMDESRGLQLRRAEYTIGWVCALPIELAAAQEMLDEEHDELDQPASDNNVYMLGRICDHNVVIACLPAGHMGINSAVRAALQMQSSFSAIRFSLMVGIGSGVPAAEADIRLGDVVIGLPANGYGGVVQYDFGMAVTLNVFERTGVLNSPPSILLQAVVEQQANHLIGRSSLSSYLTALNKVPEFARDKAGPDILFKAEYDHQGGPTCESCHKEEVIKRLARASSEIVVHYGTIASSYQVMKHGSMRDRLSMDFGGVLCFEMEAAGLMSSFPCLVIRGICDYADSHKNRNWQAYAAGTAAACAKEVLSLIPQKEVVKARTADETIKTASGTSNIPGTIAQSSSHLTSPIGLFDDQKLDIDPKDERIMWAKEFFGMADDFYIKNIASLNSDRRIRIAILDTGVDTENIFWRVARRTRKFNDSPIKETKSFVGEPKVDEFGHGTDVAALISRIAPEADLYIAKISHGQEAKGVNQVVEAIEWAERFHVHIINMSFGLSKDLHIRKAIDKAVANGVIFVAAATNNGGNIYRAFPANLRNVLCIHATDGNGNASALNPSPMMYTENLSTLGVAIESVWHEGSVYREGTSYATAIAAAMAANVLMFVQYAADEGWLPEESLSEAFSSHGMRVILLAMSELRDGYNFVAPWWMLGDERATDQYGVTKIMEALRDAD